MLKSKNAEISAIGRPKDLMMDLAALIHFFVDKNICTQDDLYDMVDRYGVTEKEFAKRMIIDQIDEMDNIGDALNLLGQLLSDRRFNE